MSSRITPEELYQDYRGKVERYISARVSNVHDRADLLQQVFLRAIQALEDYDPARSAPGTWLYTITRSTVTDYYRRSGRQPDFADFEELEEVTAASAGAEEQVLTNEMLEALAAALEKLSQRERSIIIFRFYHGLSAQETAKRVGVSYANVRFLQYSALKKLRQYLGEEDYP